MKTRKKLTKKQLILQKEKSDKKSNRILIAIGLGIVLIIITFWGFQYYNEYKNKTLKEKYLTIFRISNNYLYLCSQYYELS